MVTSQVGLTLTAIHNQGMDFLIWGRIQFHVGWESSASQANDPSLPDNVFDGSSV
jgi:hypothetical protein